MEGFEIMKAVKQMRNDDIIIACMGPTGGGKGFFTDLLFNHLLKDVQCGDVDKIRATRIKHPNSNYNDRIVFLNTPDFDNTIDEADIKITSMIKAWLKENYSNDVSLTELIYVHNIAETSALNSLGQNLPLFGELCGWGKLSHVTLVSTMWDEVPPVVGITRDQELRSLFSRPVTDNGVNICRLQKGTSEEAWKIVDSLISDRDERESALLLQKLSGFGVQLNKTEAGREIYRTFRKLVLDHGEDMQSLLARIDASDNPVEHKKLRQEYVGIRESFQTTLKAVKEIGIRPGKLIMNPFFEWRIRARTSAVNNYLDLDSPLAPNSCASEFDGSTLQSFSEAEQSEDVDQVSWQISATLVDITQNAAVQHFITNLAGDDAQCMIDFLNYVLGREDVNARNRRKILFLMWKLARSANVFPKYHDVDEALPSSIQKPEERSSSEDANDASRVDFQRVFSILDPSRTKEKLCDEATSPNRSRQATLSPTLSHLTDNCAAPSTSSPETSLDLLSSVSTARVIHDLRLVSYPEGIQSPDPNLNANVQNGKFRYDPEFLLQFMTLCKARPVALPPIELLGIKRLDKPLPGKKTRRHQTTASANEKPTPSPRSTFSKSPESPVVNALPEPLPSAERFTDINYYLPADSLDSSPKTGYKDWFTPDTTKDVQLDESPTFNPHTSSMLQGVPKLSGRGKRGKRSTISAPVAIGLTHDTAAKGKPTPEKDYSPHQISRSRGSSIHFGSFSELPPASLDGWGAAGKPTRPPSKVDLSKFGKINKSPPPIFGPGSIFGGKRDSHESQFPSRAN